MWIALMVSLLIMVFALAMERVEATLTHPRPPEEPAPDSAAA